MQKTKKKYIINKHQFTLKEDYTLDDLDEVQGILRDMSATDNVITGKVSNKELKRFLELVTEPIGKLPDNFNYNASEKAAMEVFKDFFLSRIELRKNTSL